MTGMIWDENPNSRMLIRVLKRQLEHKFASCSMPSNPLNLWETNSSMWFSPPFLDHFPTGLPYVSLSGRFFRWPAVCWPPCAWSAAEARNRASKLWGITSSSFRCARGTGASWKHRGPRCQSFCRSLVFFLGFKLGPCWWGKPNIQWFIKFITICLISGFKFAISQYLNIFETCLRDDHHSNWCRDFSAEFSARNVNSLHRQLERDHPGATFPFLQVFYDPVLDEAELRPGQGSHREPRGLPQGSHGAYRGDPRDPRGRPKKTT